MRAIERGGRGSPPAAQGSATVQPRAGGTGGQEKEARREKEARTIRDFIRRKFNPSLKHRYLIGGDFNDHKNSPSLRRFLQVNDQILSQLVPCVDSNGHFWTHYYAKEDSYARLDYLLVSPAMQNFYVHDSAAIYDGHNSLWASDHRMVYADFEF